jgi:hypothetical protein
VAISPTNALKLSAWLYVHQPDLFRQILVNTGKLKASPLGRLGYFGDDASFLDSFTPDLSAVDVSAATVDIPMDTSNAIDSAYLDATLADTLDANVPVAAAIENDPAIANSVNMAIGAPAGGMTSDPGPAAGGFWSSIASGAAGALGAVGKVAAGLVSPTVLGGAAMAATSYFNSQAKTAQLQAQQSATATQFARVGQGYAPAPLTYTVNPQTGQMTPVYAGQNGSVPLTAGLAQQLSAPSIGGLSTGTVLLGGGLLLFGVFWALSSSSRR